LLQIDSHLPAFLLPLDATEKSMRPKAIKSTKGEGQSSATFKIHKPMEEEETSRSASEERLESNSRPPDLEEGEPEGKEEGLTSRGRRWSGGATDDEDRENDTIEDENENEPEDDDVERYFEVDTTMEDFTVGQESNVYESLRRRWLSPTDRPSTLAALVPHLSSDFVNAFGWSFRMTVAAIIATFFALYPATSTFFGCTPLPFFHLCTLRRFIRVCRVVSCRVVCHRSCGVPGGHHRHPGHCARLRAYSPDRRLCCAVPT
jgi:hypothetical protein